ncbi:hypothetical protein [Variovorax paradoxus]|uniref:hypothetical protein n=1 Tax=Variovorax paradoxus TaxID=34073 RepID=UPI003D65A546
MAHSQPADTANLQTSMHKSPVRRLAFAVAVALSQVAAWSQPTPVATHELRGATPSAEAHVRAVSSIKRLTDGVLSCAELQSRIEDLERLSVGTAQRAESAVVGVERAQREVVMGATLPAPSTSSLAAGAAVTALESVPVVGNLASSLIAPSFAVPSGPANSAQAHAAALRSVMEAGQLQMIQYATAARRDHLRALYTRNDCVGGRP